MEGLIGNLVAGGAKHNDLDPKAGVMLLQKPGDQSALCASEQAAARAKSKNKWIGKSHLDKRSESGTAAGGQGT
jgi:hypothetical protein